MRRKIHWIVLPLFLFVLWFPQQAALADMGPKPQMDFEIVDKAGLGVTIQQAELLECDNEACLNSSTLEDFGPQGLYCQEMECSAWAYGFKDFHRLVVTFSDGVVRESNVFGKQYFNARYRVTIQPDSLLVEEVRGGLNPLLLAVVGVVIAVLFIPAILVLIILLIVRQEQGKGSFQQSKAFYIFGWLVALPFLALSALFGWTLLLTELIELLLIWVYIQWRKRPRLEALTVVLLANLLTQPPLLVAMQASSAQFLWLVVVIGEILIWLFEALIFYLVLRKSYTLKEAIAINLVLNLASVLVGLWLRV